LQEARRPSTPANSRRLRNPFRTLVCNYLGSAIKIFGGKKVPNGLLPRASIQKVFRKSSMFRETPASDLASQASTKKL
jgi:hypothetical protein